MSAVTADLRCADRAPEAAAPEPDLVREILALTSVRTRDLRLSPRLISLYARETWHSRKKMNVSALGWCAAVNLACGAFDPLILQPDFAVMALWARAVVSAVFAGAALAMWRMRKPGAEGSIVIGAFLFAFFVAGLGGLAVGPERLERYVVEAIFFGGTAVMATRVAWRDTVFLAAALIALTTVFLSAPPAEVLSLPEKLQGILFFDGGLVGLALAKRSVEQLHFRVFILTMSDRLALRKMTDANKRLEEAATTDPLTGVANRRRFDEVIAALHGSPEPISLVMIDIDHFKSLNDALGHKAGDQSLVVVAGLLRSCLREGADLLARFGGEEFVALLPGLGAEDAILVAERLRDAVEARGLKNPGGIGGVVTVSAGVAALTGERLDLLLGHADAALYEAKSAGRNAVRFADPGRRRRVA